MTHSSAKPEKKLVMSLKYTAVPQSKLCLTFFTYVATVHHLQYCGQESIRKQFAVYDSDTTVTLKQGQGHRIWSTLADVKKPKPRTNYVLAMH